MVKRLPIGAFMAFAAAVALGVFLLGLPGVAFATHYNTPYGSADATTFPAKIEPETIPLWGPTWDHSPVTYRIEAGLGVTQPAIDMVQQAITDWNHAIAFDTGVANFLFPAPEGATPDLIIKPKLGGGMVQGQALCSSDANGFFIQCKINVSGKAFGLPNLNDTVRSIAIQEIGHGLGLLHAEGDAAHLDVMFGTLQDPPNIRISFCDLDAWAAVMAWLTALGGSGTPAPPTSVTSVSCGTVVAGGGVASGLPASVTVTTDKASYVNGETARITVTVKDGGGAGVADASVTVILTSANGSKLSGSGTTDASGVAKFTYKVNSKRDGVGTYSLTAEACKSGTCASGSTTFNVTQ